MSLQEAVRLRDQGRFDEARSLLENQLRSAPRDTEAVHLLGTIAFQQGEVHEAQKWMARSVELAPRNAAFRINLAAVLGALGQPREALEQLRVGVTLPGGNRPELHNNIGVAHERLGELREAAGAYRRALSLNPNYVDAHMHLGNVCRKASRFDEAAGSYERVLRLRPDSAKALEAMGACYAELGDAAGSVRCYREAVELDPHDPAGAAQCSTRCTTTGTWAPRRSTKSTGGGTPCT